MRKNNITLMTTCALMAAIMCIAGPLSVPIGPIPVSLTNLVLYFAIFVLGTKGTLISYVVYLLLGAFGLPVFSGYVGGIAKIAGPTGGYLIGFIPMILIMGFVIHKTKGNIWISYLGMVIATAIAYLFGTLWFVISMSSTWTYALTVCVFPFIPFDLVKIAVAIAVGKTVHMALNKSGLLREA